jgi:hypothetical protein
MGQSLGEGSTDVLLEEIAQELKSLLYERKFKEATQAVERAWQVRCYS